MFVHTPSKNDLSRSHAKHTSSQRMPQAHCFSKDPFLSTPSSSSSPSAALSAPLSLPKAQKQPQPPRFRSCSHSSSNCNTSSLDSSLSSTQVVNSLERIIYNKDGTKKLSLVPPSGKGSNVGNFVPTLNCLKIPLCRNWPILLRSPSLVPAFLPPYRQKRYVWRRISREI